MVLESTLLISSLQLSLGSRGGDLLMRPKSEIASKVDAVVTAGHGDKSGQQTYPQTVVESGFLNHCDENADERK